MRVAAFLILLVAASLTAMASEVYKWVDEEGNVHYSDTPPENVESERVQVDVAPPRGDASAERVLERAEQTRERLAAERDARAAAEEAEAERHAADRQRCVFARQQLISLQQNLPVYRDETGKLRTRSEYDVYEGEREYLDDEQRALEIVRVQKDIERYCEHPGDRAEQFDAAWDRMMSKRCEAARAQLKAVEADRHSPRQAIEDATAEVRRYCGGED
jgi:hypothetical protein